MKNKFFIFLLTFCLCITGAIAEETRQFDQGKLDEYRAMDKYDYDQVVKTYEPSLFMKILGAIGEFLAQGIGSVLIVIAVIALVGLIIYLIFKSGLGSTVSDKDYSDEIEIQEVEDINELDLDKLLADALANGNHRMATRIMYLQVLKGLNKKKLIDWQNEKTNYDYIREIKDRTLSDQLDQVTYIYEYIWYGEAEINALSFEQIEPQFKQLIKEHH